MAGRRRGRAGGKSAYKMTARRKAALKKAQMISARKRRKNGALKAAGVVGLVGTALVLGHKYGDSGVNMAKDLKGRAFRFTNPKNSAEGVITPDSKEAVMKTNAASPASAARQAAPVQPPNMNNTSTPRPRKQAKVGFGGHGKNGATKPGDTVNVTPVAQAERIIDPEKPAKPVFPAEHLPPRESVLRKMGASEAEFMALDSQTQRNFAMDLAKIWNEEYIKANGVRIPGFGGRNRPPVHIGVYGGILDYFGVERSYEQKAREKAAKKSKK